MKYLASYEFSLIKQYLISPNIGKERLLIDKSYDQKANLMLALNGSEAEIHVM